MLAASCVLCHLESSTIWSNQSLASLDKPLLVAHQTSNLDNLTGHVILKNAQCLVQPSNTTTTRGTGLTLAEAAKQDRAARKGQGHTCFTGMLLASSLIKSRALMIAYGSFVLRVVRTVMEPSTRSSSQAMPFF